MEARDESEGRGKEEEEEGDDSSVNSSASEKTRLVVKRQKSVKSLVTEHGLSHEKAMQIANDPTVNGYSDSDDSGN